MFAGNFAPAGWMLCQGQLLAISENETLFNLIGTTYGGDGQSTFGLPNLQSRVPVHQGTGFNLAQTGGAENVTLTTNQIAGHVHPAAATSGGGNAGGPAGAVWAAAPAKVYADGPANALMHASAVASSGGSQPHDNMAPFLCINFIISLFGVFPSQT
jgi:microcystin-dependent protein